MFVEFDDAWPTTQDTILCCWWFQLGAEAREAAGRVSEANRLPLTLFNHQRVESETPRPATVGP